MKLCIKCKCEKSLSNFHKDARRNDGLFPYCKKCRVKPKVFRKKMTLDESLSKYQVADDGCWNWTGVIHRDGYGLSFFNGKQIRAHRHMLLRSLGLQESELLALHKCDNRRCVNPDHLYLGTPKQNSTDMVSRNRQSRRFGEDNSVSKITKEIAIAVFLDKRKHKDIARDYGIAVSTVSSIKVGSNWSHITRDLKGDES